MGFETRLTGIVQVLTRRVKGEIKDTQRYTYDNNGNITAVRNGSATEYHVKYTYDGINQLIREDNAVLDKSWTFSYDTAGNILSKKEYAYTTGTLGSVLDTKTYTYAGTGRKDRLISWDGEAIEYDAMGNPTTYLGHALTWGKIRQLESYRIDSNTLLTYAYDAGGVRIRKGAVSYQVDGNRILRETCPAGTITYEYGNGGVCGFQYDNVKYYLNSRYYDPWTCRFIGADILLDARAFPGYNLFAYYLNNPVTMMDINWNITLKRIIKSIWSGVSKYYGMKSEMNEVENPLKSIDEALELIGYLESARSYFKNLDKMEKVNYLTMLNSLEYARFGDEYEMILLDGYISGAHYAKQVKNAAQNLIVYSYIDSHMKQILMAKTFNFEDCDYLMGISASIGTNRILALNPPRLLCYTFIE